jgi:hypothetical protein
MERCIYERVWNFSRRGFLFLCLGKREEKKGRSIKNVANYWRIDFKN